jgi:hypothetical protein
MTFSVWNLFGLIAGAAAGVLLLAAFNRFIYLSISFKYEEAKATGGAALNPRLVASIMRFLSLIALPVLGFLFGHQLFAS